MTEPTASEPSMDEILASIRRIISEDDAPGEAAQPDDSEWRPPVAAELAELPGQEAHAGPDLNEDILELTQPADHQAAETHGDVDAYARHEPHAPSPPMVEPEPVHAPILATASPQPFAPSAPV
ncbi:MAG: DUF2497 domain-containing protein, partial [Caulobacteraceae bacterium]